LPRIERRKRFGVFLGMFEDLANQVAGDRLSNRAGDGDRVELVAGFSSQGMAYPPIRATAVVDDALRAIDRQTALADDGAGPFAQGLSDVVMSIAIAIDERDE
jgi:hypothetical protein